MNNWRRRFLSVFAVCLIYFNAAVIVSWPLQKLEFPELPNPAFAKDLFLLFGVFSYYETVNSELTLWGLDAMPGKKGFENWIKLPSADYFPFARGEQRTRMWATRQTNKGGLDSRMKSWRFMGKRIFNRYNQSHPEVPITKLAIQSQSWPRDPEGFYTGQTSTMAYRQYWIVVGSTP